MSDNETLREYKGPPRPPIDPRESKLTRAIATAFVTMFALIALGLLGRVLLASWMWLLR